MKREKVAVVTGANRGLGLGTAADLAERGYVVFMVGRDKGKIEEAAAVISKKGHQVRVVQADVSVAADARRVADAVRAEFGHVDALVNNAGVYLEPERATDPAGASVFRVSPETVLKTFEINTLGPLNLVQALVPLLKESKAGRIVNVSSGMGALTDMSGSAPGYRLSKTALNALTRILTAELSGTPIKVNSVCPGWVKTDMGGKGASRTIPEGVSGIVWAATLPDDGPTGGFFRDGKRIDW